MAADGEVEHGKRDANNRKKSHSNKSKQRPRRNDRNKEETEIEELKEQCSEEIAWQNFSKFDDFPISSKTLNGLIKANFISPTEIQKEGIALALRGLDVLGAAKTGSGKTLAFIIPILELLWKEKFTTLDGLGALVISPTRELAYQTFEVLRKVGKFHSFSAGLIIGGKDMKEEQARILDTNIIVCTPGRLLQHMDETPSFDCNNLKVLVLDEADRILDMGFQDAMNAIIENLPLERQTLLFSATQTKSVKDLARLSLKDPSYVSVHEKAKFITPKKLSQYFVICELQDKINFLYSFIKNHLKSKVIIFMSSCKQVKFFYEVFRRLRPGVPLMALYGKQKQIKRVGIYEEFCRKASAFLFATDIAARGLDFPEVQWVVQFDCPEDTNTYIHRVGRTARLEKDGQALLILLPSEEAEMIKQLEAKKVPIQEIRPDPKKMQSIQNKLASFCAQSQEMKYWAQRSIVSYARSVFLQSNKKVFDVQKLPIKEYAISLGLPVPPRIRFMKKLEKKIGSAKKEAQKDEKLEKAFKRSRLNDDDSEDSESDDNEERIDEEMETRNEDGKNEASDIDENEEDDVLVLKKKHLYTEVDENEDDEGLLEVKDEKSSKVVKSRKAPDSRVIMAKKIIRKGIRLNTKIKFDEDGEANEVAKPVVSDNESSDEVEDSDQLKPISIEELEGKDIVGGIDIKKMMKKLGKEDKLDRQTERDRVKRKHQENRKKQRKERKIFSEMNSVTLGGEESSNQGELSDGSDEEPEHKRSERPSPRKKARTDTVELPGQQESLKEDEELALQLLSGLS
ncbi:probable ATP-dependent RNA helicase DDX10 isoform X1 [Rhopilema esculentum]|uniref:probable ATP-dependent RNA helicase DDX10 isoform X1 n=1 Tax=Rhopilema esculentum TaxID=499914 RepID=UPI0031E0EF90